jgi:hypothetical protein
MQFVNNLAKMQAELKCVIVVNTCKLVQANK